VVGTAARLIAYGGPALGIALACVAGMVHAEAPESGWRITGQCREGLPQGGYQVHGAEGRLRVQGAFSQGQRVGSFIFWASNGARIAHVPFDADLVNGTVSGTFPFDIASSCRGQACCCGGGGVQSGWCRRTVARRLSRYSTSAARSCSAIARACGSS